MNNKRTNIFDNRKIEINVGDIIYCKDSGNYWLVGEYDNSNIKDKKKNCDYFIALNANPSLEYKDLNTITDFLKIYSIEDEEYLTLYSCLINLASERLKERK